MTFIDTQQINYIIGIQETPQVKKFATMTYTTLNQQTNIVVAIIYKRILVILSSLQVRRYYQDSLIS